MLDTILALGLTMALVALLLPLGLLYLFTRQVAPHRPLRTFLIVLGCTLLGGPFGLGASLLWAVADQRRAARRNRRRQSPVPLGVGRDWSALVRDAAAAAHRYHMAIAPVAEGPLRDTLHEAAAEVDQAVEEARRLAIQGDRTERAHRDMLKSLDGQRRRGRSSGALPADLEASLRSATQAQYESAERLAAAARRDRCQLEVMVARLHELAGHAVELSAGDPVAAIAPTLSLADRVSALRLATAELDAVMAR